MISASKPVAVVTGGSSGIGKAAAARFAAAGYRVYELSRSGADAEGVRHLTADMTDEASVDAAFAQILEECGRIDVLVCNAGWGISGAVEFTTVEDAKKLFDVNFFGALRCIRAVVPAMRAQNSGRIVCLSSVAGPLAIPYQAFYSASKAAVNDLVLALRCELRRFGIRVSGVMPGDAKTGFTANREKSEEGNELYGGAIERAVSAMEKDEQGGMTPDAVAKKIYIAATRKRPRPFYVAGEKYRLFMVISRLLPSSTVNWIIGKMYG
ncbi:MAG: SDR family NAD(P)-dependent oxidoreductase [Oscillospiraceae bacterium]|nr:SDR family NAD(P)-dependent oxidoreductase [Oscillospiraceae bacterium]